MFKLPTNGGTDGLDGEKPGSKESAPGYDEATNDKKASEARGSDKERQETTATATVAAPVDNDDFIVDPDLPTYEDVTADLA